MNESRPYTTFDEYQEGAEETAIYPNAGHNVDYPLRCLSEEVGELCSIFNKAERDNNNVLTPEDILKVQKEAGDVLWELSEVCRNTGLSLSNVAYTNMIKLQHRKKFGKLGGSEDER